MAVAVGEVWAELPGGWRGVAESCDQGGGGGAYFEAWGALLDQAAEAVRNE